MPQIHLGKAATGEQVYIDIPTLISTRLLVTASSGGGKSETLRRILEEAVDHVQCIVLDPEGEFSTLREKKPFVLVGEGGETAADIRTAALVATRLLELNASAVCDLYEMRVQDRHEWVRRFLDSMVHAPKSLWHPVLIVIDEAHTFCPEKGYSESVASQSIIDIANLGRKRGFCLIPATQRLSKLSKNVVEPMQNYLVGRTTFDDQARAASVFKIAPGAATRNFSLELEQLKAGEFIARGRAITGDLLKVQVIRGKTRPPATGTAMAGVVTPTPEAIKALLPKLADLPQEAEKRIATEEDLRREVEALRHQLSAAADSAELAAARSLVSELRDEVARLNALKELYESVYAKIKIAISKLGGAKDLKVQSVDLPAKTVERAESIPSSQASKVKAPDQVTVLKEIEQNPTRASSGLPGGSEKLLREIASYHPKHISKRRVAGALGTSSSKSTWRAWMAPLRAAALIEEDDDSVWLSQTGVGVVGYVPPTARTTEDVMDAWSSKLSAGSMRVLRALIEHRRLSRDKLASLVGCEASSSTMRSYLAPLRSLELIQDLPGGIIGADAEALFLS